MERGRCGPGGAGILSVVIGHRRQDADATGGGGSRCAGALGGREQAAVAEERGEGRGQQGESPGCLRRNFIPRFVAGFHAGRT